LQCIGATTLDEYRKYIEKDAALQRRFQEVIVREASVEETIDILKGIRERYEQHHRLTITDDALRAAAEMGSRYITDRFLPDKAIDLIDEAASRVRMQRSLAPLNLKEATRGLEAVMREKEQAIQAQDYDQAAELRDREIKLRDRIAKIESGWQTTSSTEKPVVNEEHIAQIVSMWTGIPVMRIAQEESARLLQMEEGLHSRVIGQDEAIATIARAVRRARAGLKDPKRPIGSFIFMGPTGVGKTELAKALAEFMFGSEDALIKIDMSEFMERHAAARLVGAPPGYVGYEEGGQLTEAVRRKSYSVILLDEIEKAHPDVFNMLLQILEDGKLTDAKGRTVDFRNTIVIMTSNVGATLLNREAAIGFMQGKDKAKAAASEYELMKDKVLGELKNTFKPEFLNRIDATIVFHSLRQEHVRQIVDLMLARVRVQLTEQQVELIVPDSAKDFLVEKGYDPQYGARPLRRTIQNLVEDPLAEGLLQGRFHAGDMVEAAAHDGTLLLEVQERRDDLLEQLPPPPEAALSAGESDAR
ncbi:MAG TPA: AAA family ATPase, partial [Ktedonobacterales bacterium]|nr:AAA family ATPase [Ktedonobacterales bacterium]